MNSKKNLKTIGIPFKGAPVGYINRTIIGRGDSSYLMGGQK